MFLDFDQNCFLNLFVIHFTEPNSPKVPSSVKSGVPLSSGSETVANSLRIKQVQLVEVLH